MFFIVQGVGFKESPKVMDIIVSLQVVEPSRVLLKVQYDPAQLLISKQSVSIKGNSSALEK